MEINRELIEGVGIITPPRRPNRPQPRPAARTRCVGTACDTFGNAILDANGGATVKVTRDGVTTIESASRYRSSNKAHARVAQTSRRVKSTNFEAVRHLTAADLPAIQNYEED